MAASAAARTACFTIVSRNYLHFARTLVGSLRETQPEWEPFVLLVDEVEGLDPTAEPFELVEVAQLPIPELRQMLFRYTIVEVNTAVKPWFFRWLFERGFERVVFLDPDVFVYAPLAEVEREWGAGALAVLTPHLTGRLNDAAKPSERDILLSGTYNLGFLALARHPELDALLDYWCEKSLREFVSDVRNGLFTDQRWMDLVPGMFGDVRILRHEGYNVAYWNLAHRRVRREGAGWTVNGVPLVFFHFSGLDPARPEGFSRHQDRYRLTDLGEAAELVERYASTMVGNGIERCRALPYAFARLRDGTPLLDEVRRLYHASPEFRARAGEDPFALRREALAESSDGEDPPVTWLMRALHAARPDLQGAFPDPLAADREAFARWFVDSAEREYALDAGLVAPVRQALEQHRATPAGAGPTPEPAARDAFPEPGEVELLAGAWRKALVAFREGRLPWSPLQWLRLVRSHRAEIRARRVGDAARWKAVAKPTAPPAVARRSVAHFAGFQDRSAGERERGVAWAGTTARVVLRGARPGERVTLHGEHDAELHRRAWGTSRIALRVDVDGIVVAEQALDHAGPFSIPFVLPEGTGHGSQLWLRFSHAVVPAERGLGDDGRALAACIRRVELASGALLDFGRSDEPYRVPSVEPVGPGLTIVGYLADGTGVARSAQASATACEGAGIPCELLDVRDSSMPRGTHGVALLHVNADQFPLVHSRLGPGFFAERYTIGLWAWEMERFPDAYLASFDLVDEVWAPSQFVQRAIAERSPVPVVHMPHCVTVSAPTATRAAFGLPEDAFVFLVMYDLESIQERKNPMAALDAFAQAFPDPRGVELVVKASHAGAYPEDFAALQARVAEMPGVRLLEGLWPRQRVHDLQACCDAYVSLHRSEGFGLNLAECMLLAKPVVATHWSGNAEFMDGRNSCPVDHRLVPLERPHGPYPAGARWAEADVEQAADYLRRLAEDPAWGRDLGRRARATIEERFSPRAIGELYRRRLELIARLA